MKNTLKNIIVLLAIIATLLFTSCSEEEKPTTFCKTINSKESRLEYVGNNTYSPVYYFVLDGVKTKVTKFEYENNNVGGQLCKTLDY